MIATTPPPPRIATDDIPAVLEPVARERIPGAAHAHIENWRPSTGGYSTETCLFDLVGVEGPRERLGLVFRRPPENAILVDFDLRRQYLTMDRLAPSPVPVPVMRWIDPDPAALGTPYFVMDRIDGATAASDVPPYHVAGEFAETDDAGRAAMWNNCVTVIAEVHRLDPWAYGLGFLDLAAYGTTPPQRLANFLRHAITWAVGDRSLHPDFTRALDWLDDNLYVPERISLCWGDSRMSNVLYRPDHSVAAALDWEVAYLGDPAGDLAWMFMSDWVCSPLENNAPAPGTPTRAETIDLYQELMGHTVGNMAFSDVSATLLLAAPLIRLTTTLDIDGLDLGEICRRRLAQLFDGDR